MKIKIDIDTDDLLIYTSFKEDQEFAKQFLSYATDEDIINELLYRNLVSDAVDELSECEKEDLFSKYGYEKDE